MSALQRIGKATFSDFAAFTAWYVENAEALCSTVFKHWQNRYDDDGFAAIKNSFYKIYENQLAHRRFSIEANKRTISAIEAVHAYVMANGFSLTLHYLNDGLAIVGYGYEINRFIVPANMLNIELNKDYSQVNVHQLRHTVMGNDSENDLAITAKLPVSTVAEATGKLNSAQKSVDDVLSEMDDVKKAKTGELAKKKAEIEKLKKELEEQQRDILAVLEEKKAQMQEELAKCKRVVALLETEIYAIRCFIGDTVDLIKVSDGTPAPADTPVVLNQKLRFLDEELGKIASLYSVNLPHYEIIEQLLQSRPDVLDCFCPQPKCVTFIRVSRDKRAFFTEGTNLLKTFFLYHGARIGIIVRNGQQVFIGWTDEDHIDMRDEAFLRPGISYSAEDDTDSTKMNIKNNEETRLKETVSRYYAFAILQGLLENKKILSLPERVSLATPSKYVVHNYADTWLDDNRFGNLSDLNQKMQRRKMVGNTIVIIQGLRETDNKSFGGDRGRGDTNRTRDCNVKSGLNKINFIDDKGWVYVSALKKWSGGRPRKYGIGETAPSTANFYIESQEYIDLTYFCSDWLKYYILTQKIGKQRTGGQEINYAYIIQYLNIALEYVQKREEKEAAAIKVYFPDLRSVNEWPNLLSHWKLLNRVREITDYQAKRFARYLQSGRIRLAKHLFDDSDYEPITVPFSDYAFTRVKDTEMEDCYHVSRGKGEYSQDSKYGKTKLSLDSTDNEIAEREQQDKIKMKEVVGLIQAAMDGRGWTLADIVSTFEPGKLNQPNKGLLISKALNPDWTWNVDAKPSPEAVIQKYGYWQFNDDQNKSLGRFSEIAFYNTLLGDVYPGVIRGLNYLEREKFDMECVEITHY
jgi:hypothetical protein